MAPTLTTDRPRPSLWITRRCAIDDLGIADDDWPPRVCEWPDHPGVTKFRQWRSEEPEGGFRILGLTRLAYQIRRSHQAGASWYDRAANIVFLLAWTDIDLLTEHLQDLDRGNLFPDKTDYDDRLLFRGACLLEDLRDRVGPQLFSEAENSPGTAIEEGLVNEDRHLGVVRLEARLDEPAQRWTYILQVDGRGRMAMPVLTAQLIADKLSEHLGRPDRFGVGSTIYNITDPNFHVFYLYCIDP